MAAASLEILVVAGPGDVVATTPEVDRCLARVVRESVTNVLRHSGATRCDITFAAASGTIRLTVDDDGRGLSGDLAPSGGLAMLHERIDRIGGRLTVAARPGGGTRVRAEILLPSEP